MPNCAKTAGGNPWSEKYSSMIVRLVLHTLVGPLYLLALGAFGLRLLYCWPAAPGTCRIAAPGHKPGLKFSKVP